MSVVCFCSSKDLAAQTIKQCLLDQYPFTDTGNTFDSFPVYQFEQLSLVTLQQDSVHAENLDENFTADLFIFASRHKSAAFRPALLTHVPGNWGNADLGGKASTLCYAPPIALKVALQVLNSEKAQFGLSEWACGLEVTHHGPFVESTPTLFIEIGSTEQEWQHVPAAKLVARCILSVAQRFQESYPVVLGIGGPHYCPAFTRLCLESSYAIGHIIPKYYLDELAENLLQQAITRSSPPPIFAALDWKGMKGDQRKRVISLLDSLELEVKRVNSLLHPSSK
ncbi:MAG: D-aminoacyl-tRNA deacylase [Candidatus Hodarchaeota archaeon]